MANAKLTAKEVLLKNAEKAKASVDKQFEKVSKALEKKNLNDFTEGLKKLGEEIKDYNKMLNKVDYQELIETENPIISAIKKFYTLGYKAQTESDKVSGAYTGIKIVTKQSTIDLESFCRFGNLSTEWVKLSNELFELLALRETNIYALSSKDLENKSSFFVNCLNKKKTGGTPDSNTQIVKLLQKIIDAVLGEGNYRCTNNDLMFIHDAITALDTKEKCTIKTINPRQFRLVMMNVFAHCLGESYKLKAYQKKEKSVKENGVEKK